MEARGGARGVVESVSLWMVPFGIAVAQAVGRWGNWFNQDTPWRLFNATIPGLIRHTPEVSLPNTLTASFPGDFCRRWVH